MDNKLISIGDVLIVTVIPQITGKVVFSEFSDTLTGVTITRSVEKKFRVSEDEIFWTDWLPLTNENLALKEYVSDGFLKIQVEYKRTGVDETGEIIFSNIDFIGISEEIKYSVPTIASSIFSNTFGSLSFKNIAQNIFKKMYYRGVLPNYIIRADNSDNVEDKDFIDLFFSLSKFFSLFILFFKRFENFKNDFDLLREQVRQYGIYFDESTVTLEELQYFAQNFYDEARKRGTEMIFKRKGYTLSSGELTAIDGEFIRLLKNTSADELLYENVPLEKTGWCMRNSSPLYKGTENSISLNKTRENTKDFQSVLNFVLNNTGTSAYAIATYDNKKVLRLTCTDGTCGLGRVDELQDASDKIYVADSKLDYEIAFAFKVISGKASTVKIKFGVEGFDVLKNKLNDAFITPNGEVVSELFFEIPTLNLNSDCWYYARGIIHSYSTSNVNESKTNLGFGTNLYFNNSFTKYLLPKIQLISTGVASEVDIWDYKIRPLVRGANIIPLKDGTLNSHSTGFIQSSRFFYTYVRNNNNNKSKEEITDIIEKYLYPFNSTNIFIFMSNF